jgi:hypothetical protein
MNVMTKNEEWAPGQESLVKFKNVARQKSHLEEVRWENERDDGDPTNSRGLMDNTICINGRMVR